MTTISFFVPGEPEPQPRQKQRVVFPKGGGRPFASNYDPGDAEVWKREVRMVAADHVPSPHLEGPLDLELTFFFARPNSHYGTGKNAGKLKASAPKRLSHRPDADNLAKAVMDCLTTIGMYRDDGQCDLVVRRRYAPVGKTGCQIVIIQADVDLIESPSEPAAAACGASGMLELFAAGGAKA